MSADSHTVALELLHRLNAGDAEAETVLFSRAGAGDAFAQRALAAVMLQYDHGVLYAPEALARMCASTGDPAHRLFLAHVLAVCAGDAKRRRSKYAAEMEAECLAILTDLADKGNDQAAEMIMMVADGFTPEGLAAAKELVRLDKLAAPQSVAPQPPAPIIRVPAAPPDQPTDTDVPMSLRLRWWVEDVVWSIRFYFTDLGYALGSLGRALIGRGL